jgi:hypothetical protein
MLWSRTLKFSRLRRKDVGCLVFISVEYDSLVTTSLVESNVTLAASVREAWGSHRGLTRCYKTTPPRAIGYCVKRAVRSYHNEWGGWMLVKEPQARLTGSDATGIPGANV